MIYVISDVHGCAFTLEKLLKKVRKKDSEAELVFIGDYGDRGLNTKQAVDIVMAEQEAGAMPLRGNHDDILDWILNQHSVSSLQEMHPHMTIDLANVAGWWMVNGFLETIQSYIDTSGMPFSMDMIEKYQEASEPHRQFFKDLPLFWENDTHFALHAYFDPSEQLPRDLTFLSRDATMAALWSRFPKRGEVCCVKPQWNKIGVFGHTPISYYNAAAPIKYGQIRLIDTGAFNDEYMAAYCCEQDDWILQATDSRDINV